MSQVLHLLVPLALFCGAIWLLGLAVIVTLVRHGRGWPAVRKAHRPTPMDL